MNTKECLINSITLALIENNNYTVDAIKKVLEKELYKYAVTEIKETLPTSANGEATAHLLRATFATRLAERGVGIEVIAKLLGHANLHTINRYVLLSDDKIKLLIKNAA